MSQLFFANFCTVSLAASSITFKLYLFAIELIFNISAGLPKKWTTTIALVFLLFFSIKLVSKFQLFKSLSIGIGIQLL